MLLALLIFLKRTPNYIENTTPRFLQTQYSIVNKVQDSICIFQKECLRKLSTANNITLSKF